MRVGHVPAKRAAGKLTVAMLAQAPGAFDRLSVGQRDTRHSHTGRLIGFHQVDPRCDGAAHAVCAGPLSLFPTFYVAWLRPFFGLHHTRTARAHGSDSNTRLYAVGPVNDPLPFPGVHPDGDLSCTPELPRRRTESVCCRDAENRAVQCRCSPLESPGSRINPTRRECNSGVVTVGCDGAKARRR